MRKLVLQAEIPWPSGPVREVHLPITLSAVVELEVTVYLSLLTDWLLEHSRGTVGEDGA